MKKSFIHNEEEILLPAKYEVCFLCDGHGLHVNPSIDGNGITESEMEELGEEFKENYFNGVFDIVCLECNGKRVVLTFDIIYINKYGSEDEKKYLNIFYEKEKQDYQYRAMCKMEQINGA